MNKKLLIIQFRSDPQIAEDEKMAFLEKMGTTADHCIFTNILQDQEYTDPLEQLAGIIIAGSGDQSLTNEYRWFSSVAALLKKAFHLNIPILGICFGHQLLAMLHGAQVVHDVNQRELGTVDITLGKDALAEPLFRGIDPGFSAIAGHNDSVVDLTPALHVLASNETCGVQAFKVADKPIYGVQFHPELTEHDYQKRLTYYRDYYASHNDSYQDALQRGTRPTNCDTILRNFYSMIAVA